MTMWWVVQMKFQILMKKTETTKTVDHFEYKTAKKKN